MRGYKRLCKAFFALVSKLKSQMDEVESENKGEDCLQEEAFKTLLTNELERQGLGGKFVWAIFFLCVAPNILNGFHVSSYTFIGHLPDDQWCEVNDLQNTSWTLEQKRLITERNLTSKGCTIWNWNYKLLSNMTFDGAWKYINDQTEPDVISCRSQGHYNYTGRETTFVTEWDLVCEKSLDRTSAMFAISLGKLLGSLFFGLFADKYGRKMALTLGCYIFIVSSCICTYAPWYNLFLLGRLGLGIAAPGFFYPALTIIVENVSLKHRSWMSVCFVISYSVGLIALAGIAYYIQPWRHLQLALTIPSLLLIISCYLVNESVQWLITQKRYDEAYKILFKQKNHFKIIPSNSLQLETEEKGDHLNCWTKIKQGPLKQIFTLFATPRRSRYILTSNLTFCVLTLSYYVTALNAPNISVSHYLFVAFTGLVDLPAYLIPVVMLRCIGQRTTTTVLFWFAGLINLLFLLVPTDNMDLVVTMAMLGRAGVLASYAVMNLYHAEIYPTEIRNSALGSCSMWGYIGAIIAPYVVDIGGVLGWYIPTTICGCAIFFAGVLQLTLPETHQETKSKSIKPK